jgi:2-polyprenyl-3-methyl-5-hydroxy-6-metoxy-1,4-benzoquinol methylase
MSQISKYAETNIEKFDSARTAMYRMYDHLFVNTNPESKILEIWPGNGGLSYYLADKYQLSAHNIYLVDLSESVVSWLKTQQETKQYNISLSESVRYLTDSQERFDWIILRHVLEHHTRAEITALMPLIESRLVPGGRCFIEVPNLWNGNLGAYMYYQDYSHFTGFTQKSLEECVAWNTDRLGISTHNILYPLWLPKSGKLWAQFFIGFWVEVLSTLAALYTAAYWNRVFTPRLVAILTKKL